METLLRMHNEDQFYMGLAFEIAKSSRAERLKVGAILVKDGNIISFGYNGTPKGFDNACEIDGYTKPEVLHAESNAITKCAKSTMSSDGATLYTTDSPCFECVKLIIQSGIKKVVYARSFRDLSGLQILTFADINHYKLDYDVSHT